jgi:hypothetical protein
VTGWFTPRDFEILPVALPSPGLAGAEMRVPSSPTPDGLLAPTGGF